MPWIVVSNRADWRVHELIRQTAQSPENAAPPTRSRSWRNSAVANGLRAVRDAARLMQHRHFQPFVFIHINKTGGSSIERALGLHLEHMTALEKRAQLGIEHWDRKFTFAFVRNPWDRAVSHYHYRVQTNQNELRLGAVPFESWIRKCFHDRDPRYLDKPKMFMPQSHWLVDGQGRELVEFVGRFERLDQDFAAVCSRLGRSVRLPRVKASSRTDYRPYYSSDSRALVGAWYADDVERFGYQF
jgi:hypothetical protein